MFEPTSRYDQIETATFVTPDGRRVAYKRRRFLPQGAAMPLLVELPVVEGDRLDTIAARTLGDPEQFWRVCDANDAMRPADLLVHPGARLRVPVPQAEPQAPRPAAPPAEGDDQ